MALRYRTREGTYYPTPGSDRDTSYILRDSVSIYGGFLGVEDELSERVADPTMVVLSGDIGIPADSTDNVYHVMIATDDCVACIVDGLTISFGHANGVPSNASIGAGMIVEGVLLIENLIFERNTTLLDGAAIYNSGAAALLTVRDCLFRLNTSALERDILNNNGAEISFEGVNTVQD